MSAYTDAEHAALTQAINSGAPRQLLTFALGGETYALAILKIKEIIGHYRLTRVPMMPPAVRGVINLRGAVVPVLDLALRLGREPVTAGRRACIVVVETMGDEGPLELGLLVDAVNEVIDLASQDIEQPPSFGVGPAGGCIAGMGRTTTGFTIILDAEKLARPLDPADRVR
jgi:purine-binding chemotaxis protein CheW